MLGSNTAVAVYLGILGTLVGSFLNVCILRLPKGESIVRPPSHCPHCGGQIRWFDNIPVLSFLLLRGKCRGCRAAISLQYPLVEAACGVLVAGSYLRHGLGTAFFADALLLILLLGILVTDARNFMIPDLFSLGGAGFGLLLSFFPGGLTPLQSVLGLLLGGGTLYLVALAGQWAFKREALGGGDIKMMAMIGAFLGWKGVVFAIFAGSVLGSAVYGWTLFSARPKKLIPFGVFLAIAAAGYLFWGARIIGWYLGLFRSA